jgi:hypothetical protein
MYLQETKLIDLRTSKVDEKRTDRSKADYYFTDKRYINYRGDRAAIPPYKFQWNRYNPKSNFREIEDWKIKYKASFVTPEDPYWPEGVVPQNGMYILGDAVLMKIPIIEYAKKRKAEIAASEARPDAIKNAWHNECKGLGISEGADFDIPDTLLNSTNPNR